MMFQMKNLQFIIKNFELTTIIYELEKYIECTDNAKIHIPFG